MHSSDIESFEPLARELRREIHLGDAARARVMAAVRRERRRAIRTGWLSPVLGAALAASVIAVGVSGHFLNQPRSSVTAIAADTGAAISAGMHDTLLLVRFALHAPAAARVSLVGDFNGWRSDATPLARGAARGTWVASVPLARGSHRYAFVVDDTQWVADATDTVPGPGDRAAARLIVPPLPQ